METVPWFSSRLLDDGPIFLAASLRDSQFQVAEFSDGESIFVSARCNAARKIERFETFGELSRQLINAPAEQRAAH